MMRQMMLRSTVFDENGSILPVGHVRMVDDTGCTQEMVWSPVPRHYSPPVGVWGVRVMMIDVGNAAILPLLIGANGWRFKSITAMCEGVLYIFVRPGTTIIEIWGTYAPGIDKARDHIVGFQQFLDSTITP